MLPFDASQNQKPMVRPALGEAVDIGNLTQREIIEFKALGKIAGNFVYNPMYLDRSQGERDELIGEMAGIRTIPQLEDFVRDKCGETGLVVLKAMVHEDSKRPVSIEPGTHGFFVREMLLAWSSDSAIVKRPTIGTVEAVNELTEPQKSPGAKPATFSLLEDILAKSEMGEDSILEIIGKMEGPDNLGQLGQVLRASLGSEAYREMVSIVCAATEGAHAQDRVSRSLRKWASQELSAAEAEIGRRLEQEMELEAIRDLVHMQRLKDWLKVDRHPNPGWKPTKRGTPRGVGSYAVRKLPRWQKISQD